jgi:adenosylhomocysteine nucleosidase
MRPAAVTGLAAEAKILQRLGLAAAPSAGDAARTDVVAARLVASGADALVSFGIAGALDPSLGPGALLLPRRVIADGGASFEIDADWRSMVRDRLAARGLDVVEGDLFGGTKIAASQDEKSLLHRRTGAVAVDLESGVVALAAQRLSRPLLVLRAIADPADFTLPHAASVGLDENGRAALGPVLRALLGAPGEVLPLVRLAAHTRRALAALARAAPSLIAPEFRRE